MEPLDSATNLYTGKPIDMQMNSKGKQQSLVVPMERPVTTNLSVEEPNSMLYQGHEATDTWWWRDTAP